MQQAHANEFQHCPPGAHGRHRIQDVPRVQIETVLQPARLV